jgi:topoisomerase IA-like protein
MRYTIETGKYGQYVRDNEKGEALPLDTVTSLLNDAEREKFFQWKEAFKNMRNFALSNGLDVTTIE